MFPTVRNTIRVLLVDDHQSFIDGLAMVINTQKPRIEVAGTATTQQEAMDKALKLKPDIILLDMDLGETSSLDFIPSLVEKCDSKILILTGVRNPDIHDSAIMKGARGVLLKGESGKVILKAIEKVDSGEIWAANTTLSRVLTRINNPSNNQQNDAERKITTLTKREREIISSLVEFESATNDEIADELFISPSTLKNHLSTIYSKLEVRNRVQLIKFAIVHKLAKPLK